MMNYDFDYYSGKNLYCPTKPVKPTLGRNPSAIEARAWADAMEEYESEFEVYLEDLDHYNRSINNRVCELKTRLRDDYDITDSQLGVLWSKAWEDGHDEGLRRVVDIFNELYDIASQFAALEKG
jgi:hypothetical protein